MSAAGHLAQPADAARFAAYRAWLEARGPAWRATKVAAERVRMLDEYLALLPVCIIARCPHCDAPVREPFDTMSLNGPGWSGPSAGFGWVPGRNSVQPLAPDCVHLCIVAWYLNLEGRTPDDLLPEKVIRTGPEVPSLMRVPLRVDGAAAVIRPIPVGRWDDERPAHRYTTWFVSYFAASRDAFLDGTRDWGVHYGRVEFDDVDYDLAAHARAGRLRWIEAGTDALAPPDSPYPYAGIEGDRSAERILRRSGVEHPPDGVFGRVSRWLRPR